MAKHRINTDRTQARIYLYKTSLEAELYLRPALNLKEKFLTYYGFNTYGDTLERWDY